MTLRGQTLLFGLGITLVLSLLSIASVLLFLKVTIPALEDDMRRKTSMSITTLAKMDVDIATSDIAEIERQANELRSDPDLTYIRVVGNEGDVLYSHGERPTDSKTMARTQHAEVQLGDGFSYGSQDVLFEGLRLGHVELAYTALGIKKVRKWIRLFVIGSLLLVFASVVISIRFAASIVGPIQTMVAFTKDVEGGNFLNRITEKSGATEVQLLADHLNSMTDAIHVRDRSLAAQQERLKSQLGTIRKTREQLLSSTRLAAVGEMAGRMAHEVLNPVASIHGRVTRMAEIEARSAQENIAIIGEIIGAWSADYADGGIGALAEGMKQICGDEPERPIIEEDLENLRLFIDSLASERASFGEDLKFLLREVDRITHIVDAMRSMTRSSGSKELHKVANVLSESSEILQDSLKKRNIEAHISCDELLIVSVDRYELIQVITNLVRNAMMAIEEDRGRSGGRVTLQAEQRADRVQLRISDDGPGIPEEHRSLIFESNFTTRSSSEGTGLGLAIARRLVRSFGGDLILESSKIGVGSVFLIDLPDGSESKFEQDPLYESESTDDAAA